MSADKTSCFLGELLFAEFSVPVSVTRGVSALRNASTASKDGLFAKLEGLSNIFVHEDCRKTTPEPIQSTKIFEFRQRSQSPTFNR